MLRKRWLLLICMMIACISPSAVHAQGGQAVIVREGDTLTSIAKRYGVSVDAIIAANKLVNPDAVYVGERLVIPPRPGQQTTSTQAGSPSSAQSAPGTYTVQPGDALSWIADQLGVSLDQLMAANKITDPALIQIGQVLKIPSSSPLAPVVSSLPPLADGTYTLKPDGTGPSINVAISGGHLVSLELQTTSSGKQLLPLSCEAKVASQIAMMYGLNYDEMSFQNTLPHALNPRRGFVGSVNGRFYWPTDIVGGTATGPGGYGVHVEGWVPTFQALSGFQTLVLSSGASAARAQIDNALRRGEPVAVWAILGFRAPLAQNSVWIGATSDGTAIDCGGPGGNCNFLASGEHAYLILGRDADSYVVFDPGSGQISHFSQNTVINGITTLFAAATGSAPGAVIVPGAGHVPDMRPVPGW